jgi:DNA gyrase/topoisomerase IV subunit B
VLTNKELSDLVSALGCGTGKDFDAAKLRYHKICLLMDADSDGNHICTLLLTFFYRHLPDLVRQGYVYIAQPPLYRIDAGKQVSWARDDAEKERLLASFNGKRDKVQVTRFKGLGEMNPSTLKETTLDPKRARFSKVASTTRRGPSRRFRPHGARRRAALRVHHGAGAEARRGGRLDRAVTADPDDTPDTLRGCRGKSA